MIHLVIVILSLLRGYGITANTLRNRQAFLERGIIAMHYPLEETIDPPALLVGRVEEFGCFNTWLDNIPHKLAKSRVILAQRKSGTTWLGDSC